MSGRVARAALAAAALAAAAGPARAYVRTAPTGIPVAWPVPVVTYDLSSAPLFASPTCAATGDRDPVEESVRASFSTWEVGCGGLKLVYGGKIPEIRKGSHGAAENVVIVRKGWCSQQLPANEPCMLDDEVDCGGIYDCFEDGGPIDWGTVALTTILYDPDTGRLFDADIEVNGWDGAGTGTALMPSPSGLPPHGYYFTCGDRQPGWTACTTYGEEGCFAYDLQNTVTHEAGHFVGFAHPCEPTPGRGVPVCSLRLPPGETVPYVERTMYPQTSLGETTKRALSPDEEAAMCDTYPAPGGCGCGSGGTPGLVAGLLAALALRRRVRR